MATNFNRNSGLYNSSKDMYKSKSKLYYYLFSQFSKNEIVQLHSSGNPNLKINIGQKSYGEAYIKPAVNDRISYYDFTGDVDNNVGNSINISNIYNNVEYRIQFHNIIYKIGTNFIDFIHGSISNNHEITQNELLKYYAYYKHQYSKDGQPLTISVDMKHPLKGWNNIDPLLFLGYFDPTLYPFLNKLANKTDDIFKYYIDNELPKELEERKTGILYDILTQGSHYMKEEYDPDPPSLEPIQETVQVVQTDESDDLPQIINETDETGDDLPNPSNTLPTRPPITSINTGIQTSTSPVPAVTATIDPNELWNVFWQNLKDKLQPWIDWQKVRFTSIDEVLSKILSLIERRITELETRILAIKCESPTDCFCQAEINALQDEIQKLKSFIDEKLQNVIPQLPPESTNTDNQNHLDNNEGVIDAIGEGQNNDFKEAEKGFFSKLKDYFNKPELWGLLLLCGLLFGLIIGAMALKKKVLKDPVIAHKEIT